MVIVPLCAIYSGINGSFYNFFVTFHDITNDPTYVATLIAFCLMCNGLMLTQIQCSIYCSALTTSFISTFTGLITTIAGMFMFGGVDATPNLVIGITIAMTGAFVYMGSKFQEVRNKELETESNNRHLCMDVEKKKGTCIYNYQLPKRNVDTSKGKVVEVSKKV